MNQQNHFPLSIRVILQMSWATLFLLTGLLWFAAQESAVKATGAQLHRLSSRQQPLQTAMSSAIITTPRPFQQYLPLIMGPPPARVLIAAAHIDSAISGEADEAIQLWNVDTQPQPLAGWQLRTASRTATFPPTSTLTLVPGGSIWCAAEAATFRLSFGEGAACEWDADTDPAVLDLDGSLALTNRGGQIKLFSDAGTLIDAVRYGDETRPSAGWHGAAAQLYSRGDIPRVGQIWQRKRDPTSALPVDSDTATDWTGDLADLLWGRQVRMPGWLAWEDAGWQQAEPVATTATVTVAVGPEGLYAPLAMHIAHARAALDLSLYTVEHRELAEAIAAAAMRGVQVRLLLEGSPPGGISDFQKWSVATIAGAGADVRYVATVDEAPNGYRPRYRFLHAKYGIIDGERIFIGTENLGYDAMPVPREGPVGGRRGFYLFTDAAPVVAGLQAIFATDWAPDRFLDLYPFTPNHAKYGGPPADFTFPEHPVYSVAAAPFARAVVVQGRAHFQILRAPEQATRPDRGLHALIARAGAGDAIHLLQLYEHKHWGSSSSNPIADPNPRLAALIGAARRGAQVTLLLDRYFDDEDALRSNHATVAYVNSIAEREGLALQARVGNPTLGGIHAKLLLIRLGDQQWSAVGSLNGGEVSHKLNREVVLLTDLAGVYQRLHEVFVWDWERSQ